MMPIFPESGLQPPSPWVVKWATYIAGGGHVLDLAAGSGRHTQFLAELGFEIEAVDKDVSALSKLALLPNVRIREHDLERSGWPYRPDEFSGIVVTNYLHRPLFPSLINALAPGGLLIYETFALGNEVLGKPSNPNFLLLPGELLEAVRGRLRVLGYEDVFQSKPKPAMVQRICAVRPVD